MTTCTSTVKYMWIILPHSFLLWLVLDQSGHAQVHFEFSLTPETGNHTLIFFLLNHKLYIHGQNVLNTV